MYFGARQRYSLPLWVLTNAPFSFAPVRVISPWTFGAKWTTDHECPGGITWGGGPSGKTRSTT